MSACVVVMVQCDGCFIKKHVDETSDRAAARVRLRSFGWLYDPIDDTDFCGSCKDEALLDDKLQHGDQRPPEWIG